MFFFFSVGMYSGGMPGHYSPPIFFFFFFLVIVVVVAFHGTCIYPSQSENKTNTMPVIITT